MSAETSPAGEAGSSTDDNDKDSSVECPTCGRGDFASQRGMKWHHSVEHDESIVGDIVECDWCGVEFRAKSTRQERSKHNTCGNECKGKLLSNNYSGDNHSAWVERVERECSTCGTVLSVTPHRANRSNNIYCDTKCKRKAGSHHPSGENHPRWKQDSHITVNCDQCGVKFETVAYNKRRFCSSDCESEWRSENYTGPNNPTWVDGTVDYYGPNWISQRRKARKRDHYSCQVCGRDERQLGKIPSCHHVTKLRHYQNNYDAPEWYERGNRLDNLILLCEQHHKKWEGIPLRPQT